MTNDLEDYLKRFEFVFQNDLGFSRKFKRQTDKIILRNLVEINDHEKRTTEKDCIADTEGHDRTIQIPKVTCGIRVRREKHLHYGEFTIDTKEWMNPTSPDYYVFAYADTREEYLLFYMLWHHKGFMKLAKDNKIKHVLGQNRKHSEVKFLAFSLQDIFDKCDVLDVGGTPEAIHQILDDRKIPNDVKLGEFG